MNLTPAKTPMVVKKMFPNYIWDIKTAQKDLYLTFDDGPTPEITEWVLKTLKKYNAKATFFCIGNNVKKHPDIFDKIIENGHSIGNHTNNHLKGWKVSTETYLQDVEEAQKNINPQIQNSKSEARNQIQNKLFRPPYGKLKPKQGTELIKLGYKIIMWHVLSIDWDKNLSKKDCLNNVINNAIEGSIVVFHDSLKAESNLKYALPKTLEYFSKKGFVFKSL